MDLSDSRTQTFHLLDSRLKLLSTFFQTYYKRTVRSVWRILDLESRNFEVLNIKFILLFVKILFQETLQFRTSIIRRIWSNRHSEFLNSMHYQSVCQEPPSFTPIFLSSSLCSFVPILDEERSMFHANALFCSLWNGRSNRTELIGVQRWLNPLSWWR